MFAKCISLPICIKIVGTITYHSFSIFFSPLVAKLLTADHCACLGGQLLHTPPHLELFQGDLAVAVLVQHEEGRLELVLVQGRAHVGTDGCHAFAGNERALCVQEL